MNKRAGYTLGNRKVAIVGAGFVGSSIAYALVIREIAKEIVLIDIDKNKSTGEAQDIRHGISGMGTAVLYSGNYSDCADCDLIIITAGRNRRNEESRLDLVNDNINIMRTVIKSLQKFYTRGIIMVISNPVDILTYKVDEWMQLKNGTVFGSGCLLDTSRFICTIADYVGLSTGVINGYLVGEHGDGQVPIWSRVTVGSIPIKEYCEKVGIDWNENIRKKISKKTRMMGTEIISTKGKTHYGISTCVCYVADAIINQRPTIASVSSTLLGEHGVRGIALSVPSVIGPSGVQQRIRERWEPDEYRCFFDTVEKVRSVLAQI